MVYLFSAIAAVIIAVILDFGIPEILLLCGLALFVRTPLAMRSRFPALVLALFRRISQRPRWAYGSILVLAIVPRLLFVLALGPPVPFVPDEFSYLLLADTLEAGRLTNPPHRLWEFFEAVHVIPTPTYQSQYMPGAALFLMMGQTVFGHHLFGVWIPNILLYVALLWTLRQWFHPTCSWIATAIATLRFGVASYWVDSYWGGSVPALGGTLMLGSVAAAATGKRIRWMHGLAFGAGAGLMLSTRPWEGAALGAGCSGVLLWSIVREKVAIGRLALVFAPAAVAVFLAAVLALLQYNTAVTGAPDKLPYQISQEMYGWPMTLPWINPPTPEFRHAQMRLYHQWELKEHKSVTTLNGFLLETPLKMSIMWRFYFGPMLTVLLWAIVKNGRWRHWPVLFVCAAPAVLAVAIEQTWYPHYLAPAFAAVAGIWAVGLRELHRRRFLRDNPRGSAFAIWFLALVIPAHLALLSLSLVSRAASLPFQPAPNLVTWCCIAGEPMNRSEAERTILERGRSNGLPDGGLHLVIVTTPEKHLNNVQWIYNQSDIDASQIVWAWDMGAERNQELLRYFPNRMKWRVYGDRNGYILLPYGQQFPDLQWRLDKLDKEEEARGIRPAENRPSPGTAATGGSDR